MDLTRVVEIQWKRGYGSGYQVSPGIILTARHILTPNKGTSLKKNTGYQFRAVGIGDSKRSEWKDAILVWFGDNEIDIAILHATDSHGIGYTTSLGKISNSLASVNCRAVGFPMATKKDAVVNDTYQLDGEIKTGTFALSQDLAVDVRSVPPKEPSSWPGISGAALFVEHNLVAIVTSYPTEFDGKLIKAIPLTLIESDAACCKALSLPCPLPLASVVPTSKKRLLNPRQQHYYEEEVAPSAILDASYGIAPFYGRVDELEDLRSWCNKSHALSTRLYWGAGGQGKTRFLIEAAARLRAPSPGFAWHSGFLEAVDTVQDHILQLLNQSTRLFIVIDYAETRQQLVIRLLELAWELRESKTIRIVLIARARGDWWREICNSGGTIGRILQSPHSGEIELSDLPLSKQNREAIFESARTSYFEAISKVDRALTPAPAPDLSASHFSNMLLIQMAGIASARGVTLGQEMELFEEAQSHEHRYWYKSLQSRSLDVSPNVYETAIALLTLAQGSSDRGGTKSIVCEALALWHYDSTHADMLTDAIQGMYPNPQADGTAPISPDRIGEYLVLRAIEKKPELTQTALGTDKDEQHLRTVLTVMTRMSGSFGSDGYQVLKTALSKNFERLIKPAVAVGIESGDPIGQIAAEILEGHTNALQIAKSIVGDIPHATVSLKEIGAVASELIVGENLSKNGGYEDRHLKARSLIDLAARYSSLGEIEKAIKIGNSAVTLCFESPADELNYAPELAELLHNLANYYLEMGQFEDALKAAENSVQFYREIAPSFSESAIALLAVSLNSLSNCYAALGKAEEALESSKESVNLQRELTNASPGKFSDALAMSLVTLATRFADYGRIEDALKTTEEAKVAYEELATNYPDAHLPDLALTLSNLSNRYLAVGRFKDALETGEKAMRIYRDLSTERPRKFRQDLGRTLINLPTFYSLLGQDEDALPFAEEAVVIHRELFATESVMHAPNYAKSLINLAKIYASLGRDKDALTTGEKAVLLARDMVSVQPDSHLPLLALALSNLLIYYAANEREEDALAACIEVVQIYDELTKAQPSLHLPNLAESLKNLSKAYSELEQPQEALEAIEEAVLIYRALADIQPEVHLPSLARSLINQANLYLYLGFEEDAKVARDEAQGYLNYSE